MIIGLIIYGTLDTISGGFLYDRHLVRVLQSRGHTVRVFSLPWRRYAHHLAYNLSPRFWRMLLTARVDLWLQDELNHPSLFLINRGLRRWHPGTIISVVHHLRQDEDHPRGVRSLYRWVENTYLREVDGFIFNSQTTRQRVRNVLGRDPHGVVAYPAADHITGGSHHPPVTPADVLARAHEEGPLRAVFLGNLIPRKGLDTLVTAMANLSPGTVTVDIVGRTDVDPKYTTRVKAQIRRLGLAEFVQFRGYMPPDDLHRLLRRMHIVTVPSHYEGFGIVYLEGMAFGLPAIAGNRGAAHEIITPGKTGYLVSPADADALARHLVHLHRHRDHLAKMGVAALARFRRHPTWDESMGKAATMLEGLVSAQRSLREDFRADKIAGER